MNEIYTPIDKDLSEDDGGFLNVSPKYPNDDVLRVFGECAFLAHFSKHHNQLPFEQVMKSFEAPVLLKQFHVFKSKGIPRGLATWAFVDDENHARLIAGETLPTTEAWKSGSHLWSCDLIAPWGHAREIIPILMHNTKQKEFSCRVIKPSGKIDVQTWAKNDNNKFRRARNASNNKNGGN